MPLDGNAIVYCEGAFGTTNGKTAHGLVRRCERYRVLAVVDSRHAGADAGQVLDGRPSDIPVLADLREAAERFSAAGVPASHLVVGLAPDGGRLSETARGDVARAIELGLNVDCGLHDFLTEDPELVALAAERGVALRDIRKTPPRSDLHFFTGDIERVSSLKVAVLGTDSAVGKRTTAWRLVDGLNHVDRPAVLVGTGQTAWLQGARHGVILDSLVNDFVAGELEHAVVSAWQEETPEVIVIEGQGSLLNPAYPGGFEILAACRPDAVVLQHAPARREYDGFPGYPLHPLDRQIRAVEVISDRPVVAITINHEGLEAGEIDAACAAIERETALPACDPLVHGADRVVEALAPWLVRRGVWGRR